MVGGAVTTSTRAPGVRLRSQLNWLILRTLAVVVGIPLAAAKIVELVRYLSSRRLSQAIYRFNHPSPLTVYLERLADNGYVRLEGLRNRRQATLTPSGRRALADLEVYLKERKKIDVQAVGSDVASRVAAFRRAQAARRLDERTVRRLALLARTIPGIPRPNAFISYDLPQQAKSSRRRILALLRRCGFERMHQSFYVGPSQRLREVLESIEPSEHIPRLQWGTLTVFSH
jgi:DNA-binding PadR family transcriptional regulator